MMRPSQRMGPGRRPPLRIRLLPIQGRLGCFTALQQGYLEQGVCESLAVLKVYIGMDDR